MFFTSEHKWKLLDLDLAMFVGQQPIPKTTLRYASPEVVRARQGATEITADTSADMWSFGILLFEAMTGTALRVCNFDVPSYGCLAGRSFYDMERNSEEIEALLCSGQDVLDSVNMGGDCEYQVCSLIKKLVQPNRGERIAAHQASGHATFRSAMSTTQLKARDREVSAVYKLQLQKSTLSSFT